MKSDKYEMNVFGSTMSYVDVGRGTPFIFIHGNPASSFIWRGIIEHVRNVGRCIAPDLIGMGDSDKLSPSGPDSYRFVDHRRYLDAFISQLGIDEKVILVGQDWGSALMFDWARRNPDRVKAIVHMEAIVQPWDRANFPTSMLGQLEEFLALRSPQGEKLILDHNFFVENTPRITMRELSDEVMDEYRRPFAEPGEGRRPTLTWPREIPYEGLPEDVHDIVQSYAAWLAETTIPKLFINAEPGFVLTGAHRDFVRTWKNQKEVTVQGLHFVQEDAPDEIGKEIVQWLDEIT